MEKKTNRWTIGSQMMNKIKSKTICMTYEAKLRIRQTSCQLVDRWRIILKARGFGRQIEEDGHPDTVAARWRINLKLRQYD
jgi:hypothetical protein